MWLLLLEVPFVYLGCASSTMFATQTDLHELNLPLPSQHFDQLGPKQSALKNWPQTLSLSLVGFDAQQEMRLVSLLSQVPLDEPAQAVEVYSFTLAELVGSQGHVPNGLVFVRYGGQVGDVQLRRTQWVCTGLLANTERLVVPIIEVNSSERALLTALGHRIPTYLRSDFEDTEAVSVMQAFLFARQSVDQAPHSLSCGSDYTLEQQSTELRMLQSVSC